MTTVQRPRGRSPAARTASFADRLIALVALRAQLGSLGVICALVLTMASLSVVTAERSAPTSAAVALTVTSNIDYGPAELDLYFSGAKNGPLRPAIVLVHGGGWTGGDKATLEIVTAAKDMANAGYAVFDINYPLASATVPGYPTQVQALATAVQYVQTNSAKYYADPNRVGLLGGPQAPIWSTGRVYSSIGTSTVPSAPSPAFGAYPVMGVLSLRVSCHCGRPELPIGKGWATEPRVLSRLPGRCVLEEHGQRRVALQQREPRLPCH